MTSTQPISMKYPELVHTENAEGKPLCNSANAKHSSGDLTKVTCLKCRKKAGAK